MKKSHIAACALLIVASAIVTAVCYDKLPPSVPIHWGLDGKPNGYGGRAILWLLGPGMMAAMLLIGLWLPWLSPRRYEMASFKATYSYYIVVLVCMLGLTQAAILQTAVSGAVDMSRTVHAGIFVLLILLGNPMGKVKRNFFIGIKTPWTLASERVWYATHRLSGKLMVISGLLGLVAVAVGAWPWMMTVLTLGWAVVVVVFSLVHYKRLEKAGQLEAG